MILNSSEGTVLGCLERIIQSNDIVEVRCCAKVTQNLGKTLQEELEDARSYTTGVIVKARDHMALQIFRYIQSAI